MIGRVPIPVDQTAIPYGTEVVSPDLNFMEMALSDTLTTMYPVLTSMPSLWNLSTANEPILLSNLYKYKF